MPVYTYRCASIACAHAGEHRQGFTEEPLVACPACGAATYSRVPTAPALILSRIPARRTGRPLAEPYVTYERDGSETVYRSLGEAYRGELERTGNPQLARRNTEHITQMGYAEGTPQRAFKEAITPLAPGDAA